MGATAPLHAGSSSKALAAWLPDDKIEALIAGGLPPLTPHTITDPARLRTELTAVRERGYAVSFEETDDGAVGVSAPIRDRSGCVIASLTIAGPITRMTRSKIHGYVELVREGALRIEEEISVPA